MTGVWESGIIFKSSARVVQNDDTKQTILDFETNLKKWLTNLREFGKLNKLSTNGWKAEVERQRLKGQKLGAGRETDQRVSGTGGSWNGRKTGKSGHKEV